MPDTDAAGLTPALLPLLREIGDLKRIRSAGRRGSIAERLFARAWGALIGVPQPEIRGHRSEPSAHSPPPCGEGPGVGVEQKAPLRSILHDPHPSRPAAQPPSPQGGGQPATLSEPLPWPETVALATTAAALAAARLGNLDRDGLLTLGVDEDEARAVQRAAIDEFAPGLPHDLARRLRDSAGLALPDGPIPAFVSALADQPRAGVTCPGKPRIVLQPPENHAEHCLAVAVYGVLLAPHYRADIATVFLAALAHHLHNAAMPDAGFTGETLLGRHLAPVMERATQSALGQLPDGLRERVVQARRILPDDRTPEGRAFHAADTIDRVLEIEQHLAAARLTMDTVLGEMELVHAGPTKPFQDRVLAEVGLL